MKRRGWLALAMLPAAALATAATWLRFWPRPADLPAPAAAGWPQPAPRLVLVLGAGGPRGVAHLGVLKALEELRVQPDGLVGASAGAIIGALWMAGRSAGQIERLLSEEPLWWHWLDWSGGLSPRLRGDAFAAWLRTRSTALIEQLPRPFAAVTTDAQTGASVVFTRGDLGRAIHASSATPMLFAPARVGERSFVDADRSSPVPVHAARALGAQTVIAVDVSAHLQSTPPDVPVDWREGDVRMRRLADAQTRDADVLIHPDLGYYAGSSRAYREQVMAVAYAATMRHAARLRALAGARDYTACLLPHS
jgi:NTE family protein